MILGLLIIVGLLLGAFVTHFLIEDNGYVLIQFMDQTIEMSVPILVFLFFIGYFAVRLLVRIWRAPAQLGEVAARSRIKRANKRITNGYIALAEGNFAKGERLLTKGIRSSETPLLNYLAAARAAQAQGDAERRDNWLRMAHEQSPEAESAVMLTQAELQINNGEYKAARSNLNQVLERSPKSGEAMKLLAELYLVEEQWQELADLLPQLKKRRHVAKDQLEFLYVQCYSSLLRDAARSGGDSKALWRSIPRALRNQPELVKARIDAATLAGDHAQAEELIRKALNNSWDAELAHRYGMLKTATPQKLLKQAEKWLLQNPEDPVLLLTAARLCIACQLWGKARSYIESSIAIHPTPEAYNELGQLMLRLDEDERASQAFQQGLELAYEPHIGQTGRPRLEADPATNSRNLTSDPVNENADDFVVGKSVN